MRLDGQSSSIPVLRVFPVLVAPAPTCDAKESCALDTLVPVNVAPATRENILDSALLIPHESAQTRVETNGLEVRHYYKRDELSEPPLPLTEPLIPVPQDDSTRVVGSVTLRLYLSRHGSVDKAAPLNVTLPEEYVSGIISAYRAMLFEPGKLNGIAVNSQIDVETSFFVDPTPLNIIRHGS